MKRSREESEGGLNRLSEEGAYPTLNLHLTITPELINSIETVLQQKYPCPRQQKFHYSTENAKTIPPPETRKNLEKQKALNFQILMITIGQWTHVRVYPDDLWAKFYFAKKKLIWEILDDVEIGTQVARLKRKIEIQWSDLLSFKATFHPHDETGTLQVELRNRPTFFMETNPQAGKHTQWKQMDYDFTLDQSASKCRRHTIHFLPGDLQKNLEKLVSVDSFWSKLAKVSFPTLPQSLYFDIGYGNSNNNDSSNLSRYGHYDTISFNVNNDLPQELGHVPFEELNFNMATQFCGNDGRQMNSFVQDNHQNKAMSQLPGTQVIHPSSQLINRGRYISGSHFSHPMIQDERQTTNTGELSGSQAYAPETQTNSMILQQTNVRTIFEIGPCIRGYLAQEDEIQDMEHINLDTNSTQYYDQFFSDNNDSMPPDL